ncbi:MAG: hypothetical protein K0U41_01670, partial [Gammaproteobacteria bacterium]|nr:hypothetical protein [Gammaproteobacteria bacterium]
MKQILSISPFLRVKSAMHLASLVMATLLLAACSSGGGGGGGGGGAPAPALATNLHSVQSGIAISWTNPAGVRSVTITRIDYSSADATGTPQPSVTHNNVTGDSTLIAAGRITLNITGTTPNRYYSFNITRGYDGGRTDTLASARQYLPPATINNLSPSWNTDTTVATLRWSNPQNVAGITGIRVTRNEFASFAAIAPLRTVTTIARDATAIASTNTGATGAILDITEQVTNRYYTFTVTPIYTGNVEGPTSAVTTPRLYFPPATADAVTATLGEGNTSVLLSWDNPQNVASIVGVRIISNEFANATTNVFTTSRYDESDTTATASTNTGATAATFTISTGLNADSYYTFTVAPVYAGGNLVGPASSASNRVGPIGSSFETLTASLDSSGSVILTFTNPDGVTSISATHNRFADSTTDTVADTTISSSAKSAATATNALIDDIPGLTADSYYEFTISRNLAAGDPIDSNPSNRLYIPPATTITNVMATLNSDATGAQLNWTNPANIAGITAVRITRQRYLSADGVAVVDPFSETLTDASAIATSTTEAVAASIAIPNLNHNHYYTFTVTPIYTGAVAGAESVATARLYVPPTAEGFLSLAATLDTDKTGLALRWVNPPNAVGIESIRITHQAYSTADGVAVGDPVITTTTAASAIASTTGGDAFANFDLASLPVNRYYTYTVTPTYTGGLVGPESAPSSLRYYIPPAIGGVTASLNAAKNSADLSWDNPQNAAGITEVRIKITLFNEATGGSSFVGIVDLTSSHPLAIASTNAGTMSASVNLTTPFASNLYYEFTVTPVYAGNVVGTTSAATTPRVYAPPATGALTAVPINSDSAVLLSWTNPTNAAGITAIRITSQGYDAATGGNTDGGANSMLYTEISDTESSNLMPVTNSRQLSIGENGIEADKHYEFTITPIYTGGTEGPTSAATTPRVVLLGLPSVRDLSAAASDAVVRLTWTNPADVLGVTIAYTSGGSTTTIVDNANTENLIRQDSKAFHDVQGLSADTSYTFSVTPRYAGDVDGIVSSTNPISLRAAGFTHSDIDSIPDFEDVDRDGDGLIELYNVNDLNLVRNNL